MDTSVTNGNLKSSLNEEKKQKEKPSPGDSLKSLLVNYAKCDLWCHMVPNVTTITLWMTLCMNK